MPSTEDFGHRPGKKLEYDDQGSPHIVDDPDYNANRDAFNTFVAAIADVLGLSDLSTLDEFGYADTNLLKAELKKMRNQLVRLYNAYPDRTTYLTADNMSLADYEELLKEALNKQSDFSRWALAYSPLSTAYSKFHQMASKLTQQVNEATAKQAKAENEYADKVNQHASQQDNVNSMIASLENIDSDLTELRNTSAITKTNPSYQKLLDETRSEAERTINQVNTYVQENRQNENKNMDGQ
jgi:chromosome segregation ATPase